MFAKMCGFIGAGPQNLSHQLLAVFAMLFKQAHAVFGTAVLNTAVTAWSKGAAGDEKREQETAHDLDMAEDPLTVLRIPPFMWRRAPLTEVLLLALRVGLTNFRHRVGFWRR